MMYTIKWILFAATSLVAFSAVAQEAPVKWNYSVAKVDANTYDIHLTATIESGWHIYSQFQPEDAIAIPTKIQFISNPLVVPSGKVTEVGAKEKQVIKELDITQYQYAGKVDFVQRIVIKSPVKTSLSGKVIFQVCNDHQCLPPKEDAFHVLL